MGTAALTLWNVLVDAYTRLGFDAVGDEAFRAMVLARLIEPTSKADTVSVLAEVGAPALTVKTLFRALARCQERDYRAALAAACLGHVTAGGALGLVLYDVTVRHEALVVRVEVRDLRRGGGRSRGRGAGGSLVGETPGRVGAALTKVASARVVFDRPGDGRVEVWGGHRVIFLKTSHSASRRTSRDDRTEQYRPCPFPA